MFYTHFFPSPVVLFVAIFSLCLIPPVLGDDAVDFSSCIDRLRTQAKAEGVSPAVADSVLGNVEYVERVIELDQKQPEFTRSFAQYYNARVTQGRVDQGRSLLIEHRTLLDEVYRATGVPPHYLVAFWGLETNFGGYLGSMAVPSSLATLACDPRRSEFFSSELLTVLKIVDEGDVIPEQLVGSWAGAMGHMQFMPSTFARYAVDGDGDGKRDLWGSVPDAMNSAGQFLQGLGWESGLRWGREVQLPEEFDYLLAGLKTRRPLSEWVALGVRKAGGQSLQPLPLEASILVPGGAGGPAFIVYENFHVIMQWNRSEFYALSVGRLADRINGGSELRRPAVDDGLRFSREMITELQENLNGLGFDGGEADGVFGPKTRAALREFQTGQGLLADGYPTQKLFQQVSTAAAGR